MWAIKVLSGSKKGQVFPLSPGKNVIGRSSTCSIVLDSPGISKVHAEVHVNDNQFRIVDKQSSNGTYLNGIKVIQQPMDLGDRVCLHDIFIEIIPYSSYQQAHLYSPPVPLSQPAHPNQEEMDVDVIKKKNKSLTEWFHHYLDKVLLPGVYKLLEWFEFKWVMGFFVVGFILSVTVLSVLPLVQILKSGVEKEGMSHAKSIALNLSRENAKAISNDLHSALNVSFAQRRPGVKQALIIQAVDGKILAPSYKMNKYPKESFIHRIRKSGQSSVEKVNASTVVAMIPIKSFNSQTGSYQPVAYATVVYDLNVLSKNQNQIVSLLVQSFFIAILVGGILFFLLYKMIVRPISSLNEQLSSALKGESHLVTSDYQIGELKGLCSNINSAIERMSTSEINNNVSAFIDRTVEMSNLVEMVGFPCLAIQLESSIVTAMNQQFEEQTGLSTDTILNQNLEDMLDVSLKLNLQSAIEFLNDNPQQIYTSELEFKSQPFQVTASGVFGTEEMAYILVSFIPMSLDGENAA